MGARVFAWLGGLLFVASLAFCGYTYMVTWADGNRAVLWTLGAAPVDTARLSTWPTVAVNAALLSLFAFHHSLFAREPVKKALGRLVPAKLVRSVYVWVASLLLIAVCMWWLPIGGDVYDDSVGPRPYGHALIQLAGLWITARGVARIDPLELAGIRVAEAASHREAEALQVTGPYRWVRHPLYLGWTLMVFGAAHMTHDRFAFAAITTVYLIIAIPMEERSLRRTFGDDYVRYMRQVRWRMIPFIY
jgi:protein-S-isoprenylcysteine O-methyltransferase Ste14